MQRAFLFILDGWGLGPKPAADAIYQANTPYVDALWQQFPHSTLITHGEDVGLPDGQMGNSEVGHQNIGAGRIIWQELARINKAVRERELDANPTLQNAFQHAVKYGKAVHFLGLVSDGGVHSHINHLEALIAMSESHGVTKAFVHAFTDGRDCDPKSGLGFIEQLEQFLQNRPTKVATVTGRYYAMDRDKRWERVREAYDVLVNGRAYDNREYDSASEGLAASYTAGVTDEFVRAFRVKGGACIAPEDVVICFNFRTDRLRELTQVLTQQDMHEYGMHKLPLHYVTLTRYDESFRNVQVVFEKDDVALTMGEVVANAGGTQVRIAETEKYPHVTFFFSGSREEPFKGERRLLIPSPKDVPTYDLKPEMSAYGIRDAIVEDIKANQPDFICLNFANTDMVGHTGVFAAAMKAAETVDTCLSTIVPLALAHQYQCLLIADHGNSDYMINEDGSPNTAHTKNPVPCMLVTANAGQYSLRNGRLADVAPTLLELMGIAKPAEMTGQSLLGKM